MQPHADERMHLNHNVIFVPKAVTNRCASILDMGVWHRPNNAPYFQLDGLESDKKLDGLESD